MSNRRFRVKTAVNLGALSNGRRKQATEQVCEQTEEPTEKQNDTALLEVEPFKTPPIESSCETSSLENQESHEDVKIESFKDDSPFSPPAPPVPNAAGPRGIRFKAKFKPNLMDKSRIRRYSGTLADLGSPQMIGSPCKKVRTISCSSSTENDSDVDLTSQEEVPMKKPTPIQRTASSIDTFVTSSSQVAPSPERWPRQSPAHQPDYDIKPSQHQIICPSPRQRHTTESRDTLESIDNRDPSVLEVRKADYKKKFTTGVPERTTMTMFDLIYYNPGTGSRMSNSNSRSSTRSSSRLNSRTSSIVDPKEESQMRLEAVRQRLEEEAVDDVQPLDDGKNGSVDIEEEDVMPVPQVKVGPDGSIIVDDSSTLIETTAAKKAKEDLLKTQLIFETADKTSNYGSWLKRKKAVDWTEKETVRFFKAMSILGTDFSLMEKLFKRRTRHELKMKYKKEEKANKALIDRCLTKGLQFDLSVMESEDDEEIEPVKQPQPKQRKPRKKADAPRQAPKKSRKRGYYVSSDEEPPAEVQQPPRTKRRKTQLGITDILNKGIDIVSSIYQNRASDNEVVYTHGKQDDENHVSSPSTSRPIDHGSGGSLLKSLLTRNISASPQQTGFAFPPALLAANPSLANAAPGSLVVVASPNGYSNDNDSQVLQVFVVGESPGDGSLHDRLDTAIVNDDELHDIIKKDSLDGIVPLA